jgi:hypothetical protein
MTHEKGDGLGAIPFFIEAPSCRNRRRYGLTIVTIELAPQIGGSAARAAPRDALLLQAVHIRLDGVHLAIESAHGGIGPIRARLRILGGAKSLRGRLLRLTGGLLRALGGAEGCVRGGLGMLDFFLGRAPPQRQKRRGSGRQCQDVQMSVHDDAPLVCDRNIFCNGSMVTAQPCLN